MTSEAMPVAIAKRLNCRSTTRPTSACATRKASACFTLTCPAGIGRERVRSTLASRSRSVMSFQVQPAPRMAKAPAKNRARTTGNRLISCGKGAPKEQGKADRHWDDCGRKGGGDRGRPPAWQQEKPAADGAIEAGEPQV